MAAIASIGTRREHGLSFEPMDVSRPKHSEWERVFCEQLQYTLLNKREVDHEMRGTQLTVGAELMVVRYGAQEAVYLWDILSELSFKEQYASIRINPDITGGSALAKNRRYSPRINPIALCSKLSKIW